MKAQVAVARSDDAVVLVVELPVELVSYIAGGGDMTGKKAAFSMDREQALVVADSIRESALAL